MSLTGSGYISCTCEKGPRKVQEIACFSFQMTDVNVGYETIGELAT